MLFRRGDPQRDRFERMAETAFPSVLGTALRLTRNREDANDLAQEAFVRAYEAFDRFDGRNFKAWLLRILTNLYINRYRKQMRTGTTASLDVDTAPDPAAPESEEPDHLVFDNLLSGEVEEALARVAEPFRVAVLLSDIEGLTYEEIAQALEVPIGTVRSRIARGRAALRKELAEFALREGYLREGDFE